MLVFPGKPSGQHHIESISTAITRKDPGNRLVVYATNIAEISEYQIALLYFEP